MIIDELYQGGLTYLTHAGVDYVDIITGVPPADVGGDAYYLGWIANKNIPALGKLCQSYKIIDDDDHDNDEMVIFPSVHDTNCPCGYVSMRKNRWTGYYPDIANDLGQLVNQLYPEYSAIVPHHFGIAFYAIVFSGQGPDTQIYPYAAGVTRFLQYPTFTLTMPQLFNLYHYGIESTFPHANNRTITANFSDQGGNPQTSTIVLTDAIMNALKTDDGETSPAVDVTDAEGHHVKLFIGEFATPEFLNAVNQYTTYPEQKTTFIPGASESSSTDICFFAKMDFTMIDTGRTGIYDDNTTIDDTKISYTFSKKWYTMIYTLSGSDQSRVIRFDSQFNLRSECIDQIIPFGGHSSAKKSQILIANNYYYINGNCIWLNMSYPYATGSDGGEVWPLLVWGDLYKTVALMYRVCFGQQYFDGYQNGATYATVVSNNDEFRADLKTGTLADPAFKNGLREWQYSDDGIQANEFTESDTPVGPGPTPRPDPEDPGDAENSGVDITLPSIDGLGAGFGFITQYAMRGSQIAELGAKLWQGFDRDDPDIDKYIQNFEYDIDPDTGSVKFSDVMDFFISFRAYPMPLGNLTSITNVGTDFYIGSGTQPLSLSTNIHRVDSYLEQVDIGSVALPFWFGDYRDYEMEITLYLPYCGTAELNPGDVLGGTLSGTYVVDLVTGSCTAYVMCETWDGRKFPVAILPGQLGVDVPITATNAGRVASRLLGDRINVAENIVGVIKNASAMLGSAVTGNYGGAAAQAMNAFISPAINEQKMYAGIMDRGSIQAPMLSGGRGLAAFKNPATAYVQMRSPFYAIPANYSQSVGDPAAVAVRIGDCTGFNRFVNVDTSGITTDLDDQLAIRQVLESGVII